MDYLCPWLSLALPQAYVLFQLDVDLLLRCHNKECIGSAFPGHALRAVPLSLGITFAQRRLHRYQCLALSARQARTFGLKPSSYRPKQFKLAVAREGCAAQSGLPCCAIWINRARHSIKQAQRQSSKHGVSNKDRWLTEAHLHQL
jgi:hypothetical protein